MLCLVFRQLTCRESVRDIVGCLRSVDGRLHHLGIRRTVSRSILVDANEARDWRIYANFAQVLIHEARHLYAGEDVGVDLPNTVYAFDLTTIDRCIALFPWSSYKRTQHAMKLHTLLDLRGSTATSIRTTPARLHDINVLDDLVPEAWAFYVLDRGYLDFERLYRWTLAGAFFLTRAQALPIRARVFARGRQADRRPGRPDDPTRLGSTRRAGTPATCGGPGIGTRRWASVWCSSRTTSRSRPL